MILLHLNKEMMSICKFQGCQFKCYSEADKLVQGIRITDF